MLTEQQKTDYLNSSSLCPYCKSSNINAERIEADGESAWGEVECEDCGERWTDVYTLTDVETRDEVIGVFVRDDVPLDGDAASALSSAGMGTDEDYA
jgi:C4-type Zn-finger protein